MMAGSVRKNQKPDRLKPGLQYEEPERAEARTTNLLFMGDQLIIIGATGTAKPGLLTAVMALLAADGLQVRHASRRYQGETHFETGGPPDLKAELTGMDVPAESATLETLLAEVRAHREEFREACHGKQPAAPAKEPKSRKPKPAAVDTMKLDDNAAKPPTEAPPLGQQDTTGDGASPEGGADPHEEQAADVGDQTAGADETSALPAKSPEAETQTADALT